MTSKHTPGPWFYEGTDTGHVAIDAAGPIRIGLLSKSGQSYTERQSNARLIAEAPAMLEALRDAEAALGENLQWVTDIADLHVRQKDAEALRRLKQMNDGWLSLVKIIARIDGKE